MAIGLLNRFSEQAGAAEYDKVSAVVNTKGSPPDGLIFHSAGELEGVFQVFNIWESREHFDRFREERLIPAMKEAMGEEMVAQMPDADYLEVKIHDYQIP
jgi:hypothetical protein